MLNKRRSDDDDEEKAFDAAGLLKDGRPWRVPFKAMDSLQRDAARDFADTDATRRAIKHRIYDDYDTAVAEEFKSSVGVGSHGFIGAQAGDLCTVRAGGGRYGPEGSAGHLRLIDGELLCVADGFSASAHRDAIPLQDEREAAYRQYDRQLANAWRQT